MKENLKNDDDGKKDYNYEKMSQDIKQLLEKDKQKEKQLNDLYKYIDENEKKMNDLYKYIDENEKKMNVCKKKQMIYTKLLPTKVK